MIRPLRKPRLKSNRLPKRMTVCVAALAAKTDAIICIADKALSYGGYIQWESDSEKILPLNPGGSVVMYSDEGNGSRVLERIFEKANELGSKPRDHIIKVCEEQYKAAFDDLIEASFLRPRLLTRKEYRAAITAPEVNHLIRSLADEIKEFKMGCDLLICGFDETPAPFILYATSPGIVTDMTQVGFHAIGGGWEQAISRILLAEHKREHPIEQTLYDCFDAKANAEIAVGVGYEWDAEILVAGRGTLVPKKVKQIIEQVWTCKSTSPFDDDVDDEDVPPKRWRHILKVFGETCLKPSTSQTQEPGP
jgi:hypothetical protein